VIVVVQAEATSAIVPTPLELFKSVGRKSIVRVVEIR